MYFTYFDEKTVTEEVIKKETKKLSKYRQHVAKVCNENNSKHPEYSLVHAKDAKVHEQVAELKKKFKDIKHLVLVGIGGSNLGTEAIHSVLDTGTVQLHSLDTASAIAIKRVLTKLKGVKDVKKIVVCVISKSGGTAETLVNAGVLLDALEQKLGKRIYKQTIFIGNGGTPLQRAAKKLGALVVQMPEIVGGRYSVSTEVGLIPLALLGHDRDSFIDGLLDSSHEEFEEVTATNAARVFAYLKAGKVHYNFFAFDPRLAKLGAWYRQLTAESLGKAKKKNGRKVEVGFLPTISTAVELHSVGQLYLSGFPGVYTDFVSFDDEYDYEVPKAGIAKKYRKFTVQEVATAIYGGVVGAYQDKKLPYRSVIFDDGNLAYSLGVFMGMRMRETMYIAELMGVNAFDQPNVESYKIKTKAILGLK